MVLERHRYTVGSVTACAEALVTVPDSTTVSSAPAPTSAAEVRPTETAPDARAGVSCGHGDHSPSVASTATRPTSAARRRPVRVAITGPS